MLVFLLNTGENSIHSDAHIAARFATHIAAGDMNMTLFLQLIYSTGHILLFPMLVQLVVAHTADLNEYVVVSIGWFSSVVRWILLFDLLTFHKKGWLRWYVLPIVASLVFLPSQIPQYSFGFASLQYFFSHLGFTLGLWALVRFATSGKAIVIAVGAGIFASWSSGLGALCWPVFALAMMSLGYRRISHWTAILGSGVLAILPYVYFLTSDSAWNEGVKYSPDLFNVRLMLAQLGWAFFRLENAPLRVVGLIGVGLLLVGGGMCLLAMRAKAHPLVFHNIVPPLMIVAFGVLTVNQISALRGGLGAHRSAQYLSFWIGLTALALELLAWWRGYRGSEGAMKSRYALVPVWAIATLLIIGSFAFRATAFDDYIHFLRGRTPASAACLRSYATAPTYCRDLVFLGKYHSLRKYHWFGRLLEEGELSVFAQHQQWTMQGDTVLGNVRSSENVDGLVFVEGKRGAQRAPWSSYKRLNLLLPASSTATWSVVLPTGMRKASFESAVIIAGDSPEDPPGDGVTASITIGEDLEVFRTKLAPGHDHWERISFSLTEFAGEPVTLRFSTDKEQRSVWLVFKYPKIELDFEASRLAFEQRPIAPRNTELGFSFPDRTTADLCFDLGDDSQWIPDRLKRVDEEQASGWSWEVTKAFPSLTSKAPMRIPLQDFSHLVVRQRGAGGKGADYDLTFAFEDGQKRQVSLALFNDQEMHSYSYDLKLLEAPKSPLHLMKIVMHSGGHKASKGRIDIEEMCLVRSPDLGAW